MLHWRYDAMLALLLVFSLLFFSFFRAVQERYYYTLHARYAIDADTLSPLSPPPPPMMMPPHAISPLPPPYATRIRRHVTGIVPIPTYGACAADYLFRCRRLPPRRLLIAHHVAERCHCFTLLRLC